MPRTPSSSQTSVKRAMHKLKRGTLISGRTKKRVTNPKQAVAIGLSEARSKAATIPPRRRVSAPRRTKSGSRKRA